VQVQRSFQCNEGAISKIILHNYDRFSKLDYVKETFFGVITKTFLVFTFYKFQLSSFYCRNPTLTKCGGEAQHFQSWGFGVLRDS
jgi:hypothetical protein